MENKLCNANMHKQSTELAAEQAAQLGTADLGSFPSLVNRTPAVHLELSATTHHFFKGSFSAVSKRNFATKYAFCSIFQNLQNYLADFLKKLQNFVK